MYTVLTILALTLSNVVCQNESETTSSTQIDTTTPATLSTSEKPKNISCPTHNGDCKACVKNSECYYCMTDEKCYFKLTDILTREKCEFKKIQYLTCKVNLQYLIIGISVVAGIALLVILIFCCCCCCKKKGIKLSKSDLKWQRQREERKQIAAEKRKERAERTEEIRKKYGLVKDSNPYQKFDDEA
ncbi:hypothetical protein JTE90_017988 [Oedothorax gibbosus]|uniref:PTTG1IP n=1 Tax=Oedothorax gibbosus TaxID=931172 RepID=A0AAV6V8P4_9ARAC|nr:hypothetical protein JTE90_017988 [Oedothorax gibbosus]